MTVAALEHATSVSALLGSLWHVPAGTYVTTNEVGNLSVLDDQGKYLGYIDIRGDGRYHPEEGDEEA